MSVINPTAPSLAPENEEPLPELKYPNGLLAWLSTVDHKQIGVMYLCLTLFFFIVGGIISDVWMFVPG